MCRTCDGATVFDARNAWTRSSVGPLLGQVQGGEDTCARVKGFIFRGWLSSAFFRVEEAGGTDGHPSRRSKKGCQTTGGKAQHV